jgi:hypothetical protein
MTKDSTDRMKQMPKRRLAAAKSPPGKKRLFTLDVSILSGPMDESFAAKNPVLSRTIEIRGDQTLAHLHRVIFDAFDREDEHLYEFQVGGKGPMDPKTRRYTLPIAMDDPFGDAKQLGDASRTPIGSLGLKTREVFGYWFDFGDDWWHRVEVLAIADAAPRGKLPKVTRRVGQSPPQYVDWDKET